MDNSSNTSGASTKPNQETDKESKQRIAVNSNPGANENIENTSAEKQKGGVGSEITDGEGG